MTFNIDECVMISSLEEFESVIQFLRGGKKSTVPEFPVYLEQTHKGLGYTYEPVNTWTKEPYKILKLKDVS